MAPRRPSIDSPRQEPSREALLRLIWEEVRGFDVSNIGDYPSAARAIESGARTEDVVKGMQVAAYEVSFSSNCLNLRHEDFLGVGPTGREGQDRFS